MTLDKHIIKLFLDGDWFILMDDNMRRLHANQFKHLFGPKAELGTARLGFGGVKENFADIVVHRLGQQCLCLLFWTERGEVFMNHVGELFGGREARVGDGWLRGLRMDSTRIQRRKVSRDTPVCGDQRLGVLYVLLRGLLLRLQGEEILLGLAFLDGAQEFGGCVDGDRRFFCVGRGGGDSGRGRCGGLFGEVGELGGCGLELLVQCSCGLDGSAACGGGILSLTRLLACGSGRWGGCSGCGCYGGGGGCVRDARGGGSGGSNSRNALGGEFRGLRGGHLC